MKLNTWLLSTLAPLTAMSVLAQDTPPTQAPTAPTPAAQTAAAAPKKKASSVRKTAAFNPPASATVKGTAVNVRGQAAFTGEVLGHVQKGDKVAVLEEITLNHPQKDFLRLQIHNLTLIRNVVKDQEARGQDPKIRHR